MKRLPLSILAACLFLVPAEPARGNFRIDDYLDDVAFDLAAFLKQKGEDSIAVTFDSPPGFPSSVGDGLLQRLTAKLETKKVRVALRAKYAFKGEFLPHELGEDQVALKLIGTLTDNFGRPARESDRGCLVTDPKQVMESLGLTADLSTAKTRAARNRLVSNAFRNPRVTVRASSARPKEDSPFSVAVLVKGEKRRLDDRDGLAFVPLAEGEEYEIELTNDAKYEVSVSVNVDGISVFYFIDDALRHDRGADAGKPRFNHYVVPPKSSVTVPGWFKNHEKSVGFKAVPFAESAAAKLGKTDKIGLITATFHASWKKDEKAPADEPNIDPDPGRYLVTRTRGADGKAREVVKDLNKREPNNPPAVGAGPVPSAPIGTGFGKDVRTNFGGLDRTVGRERATISVRYERARR